MSIIPTVHPLHIVFTPKGAEYIRAKNLAQAERFVARRDIHGRRAKADDMVGITADQIVDATAEAET